MGSARAVLRGHSIRTRHLCARNAPKIRFRPRERRRVRTAHLAERILGADRTGGRASSIDRPGVAWQALVVGQIPASVLELYVPEMHGSSERKKRAELTFVRVEERIELSCDQHKSCERTWQFRNRRELAC